MVSSGEGEDGAKGIDASVGGLVWVRRRNGSWWPGRIMGLDELSDNCLISPRSGTPVKLLGREDASVDWYNLERSKRVKPFRCGEYDECIEKAKISAANSNRKAVKYARREDAIIHALELESARLGENRPDFCSRRCNSGGEHDNAKESSAMFQSGEPSEDTNDEERVLEEKINAGPELSQSGLSFEYLNHISVSKVQLMQGRRRKTPNDSGDEGTKRMRGLEDLGMGVASRKAIGVLPEVAQQDSLSLFDSNTRNCNGSSVNGDKVYCSSSKRKRSQMSNVQESLKRKNRRRPLTKVLESAAMVSVPVACGQLPSISDSPLHRISDNKLSGIDSNDSKKNISVAINNNSESTQVSNENGVPLNGSEHACDASEIHNNVMGNELSSISELEQKDFCGILFDVPFAGKDKDAAGCSPIRRPEGGELGTVFSQSTQAEDEPFRNEGHNECRSTNTGAAHVNNISETIEQGSSKWQSKKKKVPTATLR